MDGRMVHSVVVFGVVVFGALVFGGGGPTWVVRWCLVC